MYTGEYLTNFKFELDRKTLEKITKDGIKNMNFLAQQAPNTEITEGVEEMDFQVTPQPLLKNPLPNTSIPSKDSNPSKIKA
jgi:hypothetical protein